MDSMFYQVNADFIINLNKVYYLYRGKEDDKFTIIFYMRPENGKAYYVESYDSKEKRDKVWDYLLNEIIKGVKVS